MNLFAEMKSLREELERMEEDRAQFSRMIKDARRRMREFLVNLDKVNPFLLEKVCRGSLRESGMKTRQGNNNACHNGYGCSYERSEEDLRLACNRKARSFSKRNRPIVKKRFRHSVIGNGNEFSDIEEAWLLDPNVLEDDNKAGSSQNNYSEKSVEDAFTKYISQLYVKNTPSSKNFASRVRGTGNKEVPVDQLVQIDDQVVHHTKRKTNINRENHHEMFAQDDSDEKIEEYIIPDDIEDFKLRIGRAGCTEDSPVNGDSPSSVAFSREQKRRFKRKMKKALKKPENCSYLGNF